MKTNKTYSSGDNNMKIKKKDASDQKYQNLSYFLSLMRYFNL